ncbi:MAG: amidase family protein, partial [Pseudomonadota bacterium]
AEDAPAVAFQDALDRLRAAGAEVTVAEIPEFAQALAVAGPLITAEAWAEWGERIEAKGDRMFHQIRDRTTPGRDVSAADYLRAWKKLTAVRKAYGARVAGFDAVAAPTSPILPPSVARLLSDDAYYQRINLMALRNTRIGNLLGLSSLTLPAGAPGCGLMLFGRPFGEGALCRLGAAAEAQAGLAMA